MLPIIHRGHVAAVRGMVEVLLLPSGREDQLRPDPASVGRFPRQLDLQVMMGVVSWLDIFVDGRGRVDVVDHQVEPAVVIEIGIRRAIGEARLLHSPCFRLVGERQIAVVMEHIVGQAVAVQLLQEPQGSLVVSRSTCTQHRCLVIEIVGRLGIAVGDEDVFVAIVVEVAEQGAPAPVGGRDARELADSAEDDVTVLRDAVAQLQGVDVVRVAKPSATQIAATAIGEIPAHPLLSVQGGGHHVHL